MVKNPNDIGFIHDIASLDKLRQGAVGAGTDEEKQAALKTAAKQFESIFTSMLFKSMRDANTTFESDLMKSQNQDFYRQMLDEQMASEMSDSGSLGLADMIVAQLSAGAGENHSEIAMRNAAMDTSLRLPVDSDKVREATATRAVSESAFDSPQQFVDKLKPYADRAARALGVDASVIIAQAALETGWGQKVVKNSLGSSNNLFNIKADKRWDGGKVATQTLEVYDGVPVKEKADFRSYSSYQDSFNDYVRFLNDNPRYQTALQHEGDNKAFIHGIHKAGYATDPNYADKVLRVKAQVDDILSN
ncbi:flagellar assembly peptidoglycan hydrolase FlgJ [Vibrio sp. vnigr-6D03]|uniref:Peptidoglycan hydrolase FlgJ n=1 Tax=Vibrio penaeicida TaxID=104609 RepID=A0AAV5NL82_9VIBR|nr:MULTISPECIES: flagellar assembly peptidoglycan hydrolase FlgJ [Vibrio]PKF78248.1 flagellar assembly peptidoglycan hydrolase FlgJ [Vibrio sp. vnigr-6D03]RTZ22456.1 flagellar assembly peptidoglycan hydrolase FlgJ [Vibrio penaeicida]GLQ71407.1 peptidoglycan hydrolase FlgJ [Vibrio penaeicida]